MILPSAPPQYNLRDQDHIRRILERGLDDTIARLLELETAPASTPGGNANWLRVGMSGLRGNIGIGPADLTLPNPIYNAAGPISLSTDAALTADLAAAQVNDVLYIFTPAGNRDGWAPGGIFDWGKFEERTRRWEDHALLRAMIENKQVVLMGVDEPQHPFFGSPSTISPQQVNDMGLLLKDIWPGAVTMMRMGAGQLVDCWSNTAGGTCPPPSYVSPVTGVATGGGWTGIDYGMSQWAWQNQHESPAEFYDREKTELATVDVGMIPLFNFWDGGNWQDIPALLGQPAIDACWDMENNGVSSGIINGARGTESIPSGIHLNCGDPLIGDPGCRFLFANPATMTSAIDYLVDNDHDAPFLTGFIFAGEGTSASEPWQINLQRRSDIVEALQYMINRGKERTNFNGWREIK